uniref:Uncharacterized protein n=1 Tax=Triticum urartu TaxID=4572 RepID=A0A8R7P7I1_TRIUA
SHPLPPRSRSTSPLSSGSILSSQTHTVEASLPSLTRPPASPALRSTSWFVVFVHIHSGHWSKAGSCMDGAVDLFFLLSSPSRTSPAVVVTTPSSGASPTPPRAHYCTPTG